MFDDKEQKNAFLLAVSSATIPVGLFAYANMFESVVLLYISLILAIIAIFVSISVLGRFIKNRKKWEQQTYTILGVILSVLGILIGIYAIFGLITLLSYVGPAMIG